MSLRLRVPGFVAAVVACVSCSTMPSKQAASPPDLNGVWGHAVVFGLDFIKPETRPDGSICFGGAPARLQPARSRNVAIGRAERRRMRAF